jgi:hypothetical protein
MNECDDAEVVFKMQNKRKKALSLAQMNPLLRDPEQRRKILDALAYESSVFEGATGLKKPELLKRPVRPRSKAASKKRLSGS